MCRYIRVTEKWCEYYGREAIVRVPDDYCDDCLLEDIDQSDFYLMGCNRYDFDESEHAWEDEPEYEGEPDIDLTDELPNESEGDQ